MTVSALPPTDTEWQSVLLSPITDFLVCTFMLGTQTGHCWEWVPMDSLCLSATLSIIFLVYGIFFYVRIVLNASC